MEIKPVIHKAKMKYPDKYEIEADKTLLYNYPKRWLKTPIIGLTVAALLASGLTGCSLFDGYRNGNGNGGNDDDNYGILAGVPIYPYYHLSDEDALKVIADELTKAGYEYVDGGDNENFAFDGHFIDGENKIDLEYVSNDDCINEKFSGFTAYEKNKNYCYSEKIIEIAKELKETYPDAAVFQDPYNMESQESAESEIRQQVLDFIEWLISVGAEG